MLFSKALYVQGLKKARTAGIGMAATVFIINAIYALSEAEFTLHSTFPYTEGCARAIKEWEIAPFIPIAFLFSFFLVSSVFSFLNNRNGSDFYHSIPQKRPCVFLSFMASIFTWISSVVFGTVLVNFVIFSLGENYTVSFSRTLYEALGYTASLLVIVCVIALCRVIAGTKTTFILYTACLLSAPRFAIYLFKEYLSSSNPSICIEKTLLNSNLIAIEKSSYFSIIQFLEGGKSNSSISLFVLLSIEALVFLALGTYFYNKRKSEIAGQSSPPKAAHLFFKSLATFSLLALGFYAQTSVTSFNINMIIFVILSLLLYFLLDLLVVKSPLKAFKAIPAFLISAVLAITLVGSTHLTAEVYKRSNPTFEEISSITIADPKYNKELLHYKNVAVDSDEAKTVFVKLLQKTSEKNYKLKDNEITIKLTLKNGEEKYRDVQFLSNIYQDPDLLIIVDEVQKVVNQQKS